MKQLLLYMIVISVCTFYPFWLYAPSIIFIPITEFLFLLWLYLKYFGNNIFVFKWRSVTFYEWYINLCFSRRKTIWRELERLHDLERTIIKK